MSLDTSAPVITPSPEGWRFDNSYTRLPGTFFVRLSPEPVPKPHLAVLNRQLCTDLGLDAEALQQEEGIAQLAGNRIPERADPIAMAYSGHQFGYFTRLGDGRAILLGEQLTPVGFIHGVMNTDNMALSGETIDYGPCAFMDDYEPATVFSSIDREGRYAFGNQPLIAQWNLARFSETLLPLLHPDEKTAIDIATEAITALSTEDFEMLVIAEK